MSIEVPRKLLPFTKKEEGETKSGTDGYIVHISEEKVAKIYHEVLYMSEALSAITELRNRYGIFKNALPDNVMPLMDFLLLQGNRAGTRARVSIIMDKISGNTTEDLPPEALTGQDLQRQWTCIRESLGSIYSDAIDAGFDYNEARQPVLEAGPGLWSLAKNGPSLGHLPYSLPRSPNIMIDDTGRVRLFDLGPLAANRMALTSGNSTLGHYQQGQYGDGLDSQEINPNVHPGLSSPFSTEHFL